MGFLCCFTGPPPVGQSSLQQGRGKPEGPIKANGLPDIKPALNGSSGLAGAEPVSQAEPQLLAHSWNRLNPSELAAVQHTLLKVSAGSGCQAR